MTCAVLSVGWFGCGDTDTGAAPIPQVSWGSSSVTLTMSGDAGESYWFGIAETGCANPSECWYGEDCAYGDLSGNYFYCHPTGPTGGSRLYGGSFAQLNEASEKVFSGSSFENTVTDYLEDNANCWVWGDDPSYYTVLSCTEL